MACVSGMAHCGELSSRAARGCNRSLHVANHKLVADYGRLFIGEAFEEPATCPGAISARDYLRTGDIRKRGNEPGPPFRNYRPPMDQAICAALGDSKRLFK